MTEQNLIVLSWGHIWGIIAGLFAVGAFFYKLLDKKFDKVDQRFEKQESSIKDVSEDLKKLNEKLSSFEKNAEHRLTKLEMEAKNTNQRLTTIEGYLVPRKVFHFEETEDKDEPKEN